LQYWVLTRTQCLALARQACYHLNLAACCFWFSYYPDRVSGLCMGQPRPQRSYLCFPT
jgi:hypothetical protein